MISVWLSGVTYRHAMVLATSLLVSSGSSLIFLHCFPHRSLRSVSFRLFSNGSPLRRISSLLRGTFFGEKNSRPICPGRRGKGEEAGGVTEVLTLVAGAFTRKTACVSLLSGRHWALGLRLCSRPVGRRSMDDTADKTCTGWSPAHGRKPPFAGGKRNFKEYADECRQRALTLGEASSKAGPLAPTRALARASRVRGLGKRLSGADLVGDDGLERLSYVQLVRSCVQLVTLWRNNGAVDVWMETFAAQRR